MKESFLDNMNNDLYPYFFQIPYFLSEAFFYSEDLIFFDEPFHWPDKDEGSYAEVGINLLKLQEKELLSFSFFCQTLK